MKSIKIRNKGFSLLESESPAVRVTVVIVG